MKPATLVRRSRRSSSAPSDANRGSPAPSMNDERAKGRSRHIRGRRRHVNEALAPTTVGALVAMYTIAAVLRCGRSEATLTFRCGSRPRTS